MIPQFKPYFDLDEIKALLDKKHDVIPEFEEQFTKLVGNKFAISFPSGRLGLFCLLKALDIKNSTIITPSYTCIVVPSTIVVLKNTPRFVDISLDDYNIDVNGVSAALTKETRCIVPTHMYGNPANVKKLRDYVGEEIYIVEDAAQAILTKDVGRFGDAVFYSFNIEKQLFTFGGGMVTTNNEEIYEKLRKYRNDIFSKPSFFSELEKTFLLLNTPIIFSDFLFQWLYALWNIHGALGWKIKGWSLNSSTLPVEKIYSIKDNIAAYSRVQAAVGLSQLRKINDSIQKRIKIAKYYGEKLKEITGISLPPTDTGSSFSHYTFSINDRTAFENFMRKKGIQINKVFEYSTAHLPVFQKYTTKDQQLHNSFTAGSHNVNIPNYPQLLENRHKLDHIINSIRDYKTRKMH